MSEFIVDLKKDESFNIGDSGNNNNIDMSIDNPSDEQVMNMAFLEVFEIDNSINKKYKLETKYTRRMKEYSANIRYLPSTRKITFSFGYGWKDISFEIKQGLMEGLLIKMFVKSRSPDVKKTKTINMDLYDTFLNKLRRSTVAEEKDPILENSFHRLNAQYFDNMLEVPNLRWGKNSTTRVGSYDYTENLITISSALMDQPDLYEYVLYHEMLHQKFGAGKTNNGRRRVHTTEFKRAESLYPNYKELERRLSNVRLTRTRKSVSLFGSISSKKKKRFGWF